MHLYAQLVSNITSVALGKYAVMSRDELLRQIEENSEKFLRQTKYILPYIARVCVIATFFEDGIRMWFQWSEQSDYVSNAWNVPVFFGHLFVIYNLLVQLTACGMVIARWRIQIAVGLLFSILLLQTFAYPVLWDGKFFLRNFALGGGLVLLLADAQAQQKTIFAGIPMIYDNKNREYMVLAGRVLIILMFITIIRFNFTLMNIIEIIIGGALITLVAVGYKTKLSALILAAALSVINLFLNPFWMYQATLLHDLHKYDFFQTVSVVGGLLFIVILGPGGVSVDEHKKNW